MTNSETNSDNHLEINELNKIQNRKQLCFFLCVFPFGILFLIGILALPSRFSTLINLGNYKEARMVLTEFDSWGSEPPSLIGIGTINKRRVETVLGPSSSKLHTNIGLNDTVDILYSLELNHAITTTDFINYRGMYKRIVLAKGEIFNNYLWIVIMFTTLLISPFMTCLAFGIYYTVKVNTIVRAAPLKKSGP